MVNIPVTAEDIGIYCWHTELSAKRRTLTQNHLYSKLSFLLLGDYKKNHPLCLKAFLPQSFFLLKASEQA